MIDIELTNTQYMRVIRVHTLYESLLRTKHKTPRNVVDAMLDFVDTYDKEFEEFLKDKDSQYAERR
jgi:hypothetical protein